jgi:hypothetical protein
VVVEQVHIVLESASIAGTANTGGGGGGGASFVDAGANGGSSGIVIVKELNKASGVWSLDEQLENLEAGTWPKRTANIDYLVVAGGGGSSAGSGGGGGAGGYRASGYGPSPLQGSAQELSLGSYAITVGGGGAFNSLCVWCISSWITRCRFCFCKYNFNWRWFWKWWRSS